MGDNTLGEKLRERREELGLTLLQLHDKCGVHPSHLGRIERGERRPSGAILQQLAEPLGFSEVEIMKLAGFVSPDETDERIAKFKEGMKGQITASMRNLLEKVDAL